MHEALRYLPYLFNRSSQYTHINTGVQLTDQEKNDLREGKKVYIEGMTAKSGNEFNAHIQVSAERRGIDFIFENDRIFNRTALGGVELTKQQIEDLNAGKSVLVEGMKGFDGKTISQYVKLNSNQNKLDFYNENPDRNRNASQRNVVAEKQESKAKSIKAKQEQPKDNPNKKSKP